VQPDTTVVLVRHGQSEWNAAGRWQGQADPPLTARGAAQARHAVGALRALGPFAAVVASDLQRARRTAEVVADGLGLAPVTIEPAWRERHVGAWTGMTRAEIDVAFPGWWPDGPRPDGFESDEAVADRVLPALAALGDRFAGRRVVVVTHGGVIRTIVRCVDPAHDAYVGNLDARIVHLDPRGTIVGVDPVRPLVDHDALEAALVATGLDVAHVDVSAAEQGEFHRP
jgi:broad specificity phosphatase PhoE